MSIVPLYKFKRTEYDYLLMNLTLDNYLNNKFIPHGKTADELRDRLMLQGEPASLLIDIDSYINELTSKDMTETEKSKIIGRKLYHDLRTTNIPFSELMEKEFWSWLNINIFSEVIKIRYKDLDAAGITQEQRLDKYQRYYLAYGPASKIDRTGLRFLWFLAESTVIDDNFELFDTALEFINPALDIIERKIGRNKVFLKAFLMAIVKNGKNPVLKNRVISTHISNYAHINCIDSIEDFDNMVSVIMEQQALFL